MTSANRADHLTAQLHRRISVGVGVGEASGTEASGTEASRREAVASVCDTLRERREGTSAACC
jgi:hypothetical protein